MPEQHPSFDPGAAAPPTLNHVIGQSAVIERVRVALEAAWADGRRFEHSLLVGPPGTGKTLISNIIAREMGSEIKECLGMTVEADGGLRALLLEAEDKGVLLIDEIHTLGEEGQTLLLRAMEQRQLFVPRGSSRYAATCIPLANFTILGATTDQHALLPPLQDRFKLLLSFEYYAPDELVALLRQRGQALRWNTEDAVLDAVARRGRGTPRIAIRLLDACYRVARAEGASRISAAHFVRAMQLEGIDAAGLDLNQQRVLSILNDAGGPVRLNVIASRLGLPVKTVAEVVEPYLIRDGLIDKSGSGRELTAKGLEHARAARQSA